MGRGHGAVASPQELRARREAVVREHLACDNADDLDGVLATFAHPRYEVVATGEVFDGSAQAEEYLRARRAAFPDHRSGEAVLHVADEAVIAEFDLVGTHRGVIGGIAGTGNAFRCRVCALFLFEPGEARIACHRSYFDQATIAQQIFDEEAT